MSEPDKARALVLLNLGGPENLEEVRPFLRRLFSDCAMLSLLPGGVGQAAFARFLAWLRTPQALSRYRAIGGGSPLRAWTQRQARAICEHSSCSLRPFVALRHSAPFAAETLAVIRDAHIDEAVVLPMYPQYAAATTGSALKDFEKAAVLVHPNLRYTVIGPWYLDAGYLDALAATVREGLSAFSEEQRSRVPILFSAHALPQRMIDRGDPYLKQTFGTVRGVVDRLGECTWHLGFQSRSGPVRWVGPSIREIMERLSRQRHRTLLMVPVSFVCDHLETLWDMDVEYRKLAKSLGILHFVRSPALNVRPDFVDALVHLVEEQVRREAAQEQQKALPPCRF
ncbi:MAG: ferrochelatase [bacterium]|nr:ferrochelatase [bacterium]